MHTYAQMHPHIKIVRENAADPQDLAATAKKGINDKDTDWHMDRQGEEDEVHLFPIYRDLEEGEGELQGVGNQIIQHCAENASVTDGGIYF